MANFIAIIDPNIKRRTRFVESIKEKLPPIEGLNTNYLAMGDFTALWACPANAPVTTAQWKTKAAVIFGKPVGDNSNQEINANRLMNLWSNRETRTKTFFNGFYAAIAYSVEDGLTVGADLLGIYPVYYWSNNEVLLVGSSPELFKYHPYFRQQLNPQGLVSILLTMHIFNGETILKGVRRLDAGHLLITEPGKEAKEELQYKIRLSTERFDLPFSAHVEILGNAIDDATKRHIPAENHYSLLLSGGLDSRMLAGFVAQRDVNVDAVTMGIGSDIEMKIAGQVAKKLGIRQSKIEVGYDEYPRCADSQAKWEHISNGFNDIFNWGFCQLLGTKRQPLIMGHIIDAVVGTRYINWAYSAKTKKMSFDTYFKHVNKWAIEPETLKRLLNNEIFSKGIVDETINIIKNKYNSYSEIESQKAWCFNLYNRQRFHTGGSAYALSFGGWPVMPAIDRKLLECAASIPAASIAERRAQTELLCSRFAKLAALPIDRNSYDTTPLQPRVRYLTTREIFKRLNQFLGISQNNKNEHRYYYRIYDFDNPGWRAVRREAEPYRKKTYDIFNKNVLNEILPPPDEHANLKDKIADASGLKLLTGLMMWSKNSL